MPCGRNVFKCLLITFNILFWLGGGTLLGIGIWMLVEPTMFNNFTLVDLGTEEGSGLEGANDPSEGGTDPLIRYAAFIFIAVGGVAFLVGLVGFCGAHNEQRTLLCMYSLMLVLIMIIEISGFTLLIVYKTKVGKAVRGTMLRHLKEKYNPNVKTYYTKWNLLQTKMKCCGVNNYTDYIDSVWWNTIKKENELVPESCCLEDPAVEARVPNHNMCMREASSANKTSAKPNNDQTFNVIFAQGCYEALENWFHTNRPPILFIAILALVGLIVALEMFGVLAALCLRSTVTQD